MEFCDLCKRTARIRCESDQAILCWDCDARVHSANFLVARHFRNLLCCVCQSTTPWSSAGAKLEPIVLICEQCADGSGSGDEESAGEGVESAEVVVEENQVVPWSPPMEVVSSSISRSGESVSGGEAADSRNRCKTEDRSPNRHSCQEDLDGDRSPSVHNPRPPPPGNTVEEEVPPISVRSSTKRKTTSSGTAHPIRADVCRSPRILDLLGRFQGGEMAESLTFSGPSI